MKLFNILILLVVLLTGCGSSNDNAPNQENAIVSSINIYDGNNQTAMVGAELPKALVAQILNDAGQPISGKIIIFKIVSGSGSVFSGVAVSDVNGFVYERWTLGTEAGVQKVEVRTVESNGTELVCATFYATAFAGAPTTLIISSGDNQESQQLQSLPLPTQVLIMDAYGNPTPGVTVNFSASDGGEALPDSVIANASGVASTVWTLGNQKLGMQTLTATVSGLSPVNFTATAVNGPAAVILKKSGDLQTVVQHTNLAQPLEVLVTDNIGNPVSGTLVAFTAIVENGNIRLLDVPTDTLGIAKLDGVVYFNNVGTQKIVASISSPETVTFNTVVTESSHIFDGAYNSDFITNMTIVNSILYYGIDAIRAGSINVADGSLTGRWWTGLSIITDISGSLNIDAFKRVTGSGGYNTINRYTLVTTSGTWTCERKSWPAVKVGVESAHPF